MKSLSCFRQVLFVCACYCLVVAAPTRGNAGSITITTLADSGPGSLRTGISQANSGDIISFAVTGTITNLTGELLITKDLEIVGPGPGALAVSGKYSWRMFNIAGGVALKLSGLTIRDGQARNGAKGMDSATPGSPGDSGGGIYNSGLLTLSNCIVVGCRSGNGGAGYSPVLPALNVASSPGGPGGNGGGIYNEGTLVAVNCSILTNASGRGGNGGTPVGGGLSGSPGGSAGGGGGIYNLGVLNLVGCTLGFNSAAAGGAGGRGGNANGSPSYGGGGGRGGDGGSGGAVHAQGNPSLMTCTVVGNTAGAGGAGGGGGAGFAGFWPPATGNGGFGSDGGTGGAGGGIYCFGAFQSVACTIAGNLAGTGGNGGQGGAGSPGNRSAGGDGGSGGNGGNGGDGGGAQGGSGSSLQNVLVAGNFGGTNGVAGIGGAGGAGTPPGSTGFSGFAGICGTGPDLFGAFTSNGHNLVGLDAGNSGFSNGDLGDLVGSTTTLDPLLSPLGSHGGATLTCALFPGSPALDAGDDTLLQSPLDLTTDQRGVPRLCLTHVDIGAFELRQASTPILFAASSAEAAGSIRLTLTNLVGASLTVLAAPSATSPLSSWAVLGSVPEVAPGRFEFIHPATQPQRFFRLCSP